MHHPFPRPMLPETEEDTVSETITRSTAEEFGQQLSDVLNHATLALLICVGHRVGL
jgi:hypothetical protein